MCDTIKDMIYTEFPIERAGYSLHLDCVRIGGTHPEKSILLAHGSTCSSHIFDVDYKDYSFVRRLAREGYAVWRIDIAGYGRSEEVTDGFLPNTAYAAEDINAAVEWIVRETGQEKIDMLGWSWGTMTAGAFAGKHPEHLRKLVLYAPVLYGFGREDITEPFHHNTWETAAEDFQRAADGSFDPAIADPVVINLFCSSCWRYDKETSPNGWKRDVSIDQSERLIDLDAITAPTLVICGDRDPYVDSDAIRTSPEHLPEGSAIEVIHGGSHILIYEKPFYRAFQDKVVRFLEANDNTYS